MDKKARIATLVSITAVMLVLALMVFAAPKKCNNNQDDDNDGLVDYPADPGCSSQSDNAETSPSLVCDNGIDQTNDRDNLADYRLSGGDPGCVSVTDTSEVDGECDDSLDSSDRDILSDATDPGCTSTSDQSETDGDCDDLDDEINDADSLTDSTDPGCTSTSDSSEVDGECDDTADNADADTLVDYPADSGCTSFSDSSEVDGACDDGIDNDNDGLVDLSDAGCTSTSDSSELGIAACDNGVDEENDRDTLSDFRLSGGDPGCTSATDNDERDGECDDQINNDFDGAIDYPTDAGCTSFSDPSELGAVQCDDGADNDGDTHPDMVDSKCASMTDTDESPRDFCSDTDGGQVFGTQGTVSGDDESVSFSNTDFCIDSTTLKEYYCGAQWQDYVPLSTNFNCAGNVSTTCSNGACI